MSSLAWFCTGTALGTAFGWFVGARLSAYWQDRADYWMAESVTARAQWARWTYWHGYDLHAARYATVDELMPRVIEVPE